MDNAILSKKINEVETQSMFGVQLESIPAKRGTGSYPDSIQYQLQTFSDLIIQLYITEIPVTFSLRTMFFKQSDRGTSNTINIILFVMTRASTSEEAQTNAKSLLHQTSSWFFHHKAPLILPAVAVPNESGKCLSLRYNPGES